MVATVTGVAPFVSYRRKLSKDWKKARFRWVQALFLLFGASGLAFAQHEELSKIAEETPWLTFVPTVSRPWEDQKWTGERVSGMLCELTRPRGIRVEQLGCLIPWLLHPEYDRARRRVEEDRVRKESF